MGPSRSGKTTVGRALAESLDWPYLEGDDYRPAASVAKMAGGTPLDDTDRAPWLAALERLVGGRTRGPPRPLIHLATLP